MAARKQTGRKLSMTNFLERGFPFVREVGVEKGENEQRQPTPSLLSTLRRPTRAELPSGSLFVCCGSKLTFLFHRIEFEIAQVPRAFCAQREAGKGELTNSSEQIDVMMAFSFSRDSIPQDSSLDFPARDGELRRHCWLLRSSCGPGIRPGLWRAGGRHGRF